MQIILGCRTENLPPSLKNMPSKITGIANSNITYSIAGNKNKLFCTNYVFGINELFIWYTK